MKPRIISVVVVVCLALGVTIAADPTATFTVEAPKDVVYPAALEALTVMEFDIQRENEKLGMIAAEHRASFSGEWNHKITLSITEKEGVTEIVFTGQKRRFAVSGGSPEDRAKQFKKALEERLGDKPLTTC
jgi:hypothetical protein